MPRGVPINATPTNTARTEDITEGSRVPARPVMPNLPSQDKTYAPKVIEGAMPADAAAIKEKEEAIADRTARDK
jgi:hypothetical protein